MGLIFLIYIAGAWTMINRNTRANAEEHLHWMVAALRSALNDSSARALAQAEMIGMSQAVSRFFSEGNRAGLLAGGTPIFALQRKKYGLDQLNFYLPDGTAFLRVQSPTQFGDKIDPARSVMGAVGRRGEPQSAVEIGRSGPAIFGMVPVRYQGRLLGVCSVGMQFANLIEKLHHDFGVDAAVIFDERHLRAMVTDYRPAANQDSVGGFTHTAATDWPLFRDLLQNAELEGLHEPLTFLAPAHGAVYGVAVLPLRDSTDTQIGHLVAARDLQTVGQRGWRSRVLSSVVMLFALTLVAGVVSIVFNGMLLRPVQDLVGRMQAVQSGDEALPAEPHLLTRQDEIGELARIYEKMRTP